ncbi:MAG: GNAT family N-acetyltransferase [Candidatus Kapabacteria bacterium]|nr:GNAT family N-acetyltransferase [Candidatus Kapabacteria bacterium]
MTTSVFTEMLTIFHSSEADLPKVLGLFEQVMGNQKNPHYKVWEHIDTDSIVNDIRSNRQYKLCKNDEIVAVFTVLLSDELIWQERETHTSVYLHRIVANPKWKGEKLFANIVEWVSDYARSLHRTSIRMDTWADNNKLIEYYKTYGFSVLDTITTSHSCSLPEQNRGIEVMLLELPIELENGKNNFH